MEGHMRQWWTTQGRLRRWALIVFMGCTLFGGLKLQQAYQGLTYLFTVKAFQPNSSLPAAPRPSPPRGSASPGGAVKVEPPPARSPPTSHSPTKPSSSSTSFSPLRSPVAIRDVAVCFFGLTRALRKVTYPSIQKWLFDRLAQQNLSYDVFLHTYLIEYLDNYRSGENHVHLELDEWKLLQPLRAEVENQTLVDRTLDFASYAEYGDSWGDPTGNTLRNLVRQLRSITHCWDLIQAQQAERRMSYRYVMFARPDVFYKPPGLPNISDYHLESTTPRRRIGLAYEDRFAIGTPEVMRVWALRGQEAFEFMTGGGRGPKRPLHSETLVRYVVEKNGIEPFLVPLCFSRVRADGKFYESPHELECGSEAWNHRVWYWAKT